MYGCFFVCHEELFGCNVFLPSGVGVEPERERKREREKEKRDPRQ
jgi:hypothetical protein